MNHMRERHLDGTVLIRQASAGGGVFESLARPDLLITDAERASVTTARRKDRDAALLGKSTPDPSRDDPSDIDSRFRLCHCDSIVPELFTVAMRLK